MKKILFFAFASLLTISLVSCEDVENISISKQDIKCDTILIDSILKNDTAYYRTFTCVYNLDTVLYYQYTALLSPEQPIKICVTPTESFGKYKSDFPTIEMYVLNNFFDTLALIKNPREKEVLEIQTQKMYSYYVVIKLPNINKSIGSTTIQSQILESNNIPNKIYYHYDWHSSVHYDYMRYNADSAILTFNVENPMLLDTITPIDSAYIVFHDSPIAVGYNEFPLQVKDTISILDDVTFHYTIGGLLKGQKCGEVTHTIRIHKSEVISEQDETHRHQGEIYEYDER